MNKGLLIVLSGPSGCGKGTVLRELMACDPNLRYSVSATTREKREGETDGLHYYFLTQKRFNEMVEENGFFEYARYVDNSYGTPRRPIEEWLAAGHDVVLEIETLGAQQVRKNCADAIFIFMLPPSIQELRSRLTGRNTEQQQVIEQRLKKAMDEMKFASTYDYIVYNDTVAQAVNRIQAIITAEKCKPEHCGRLEFC